MTTTGSNPHGAAAAIRKYNALLLAVAGLGGLLYGMDIGIVGSALPYLKDTSGLQPAELSIVVAAMLLGAVFSTLFAGLLADWMGRKPLMNLCGVVFVLSIPTIALSHGFAQLLAGRLLEGVSAGLIGVVVPLYLAECLPANRRGRGAGVFQWLPVASMLFAALMGIYFSYRVQAVAATGNAQALFAYKDHAWRNLFWAALPFGLLFLLGSLAVGESPRWLFQRGRKDKALASLMRACNDEQAALELGEMEAARSSAAVAADQGKRQDPLLRRKYVVPFLLACTILACNTATGVNSIIAYNTDILRQSGLSDLAAHWGYAIFMALNFLFTLGGLILVDRKGRKFLLVAGTAGIVVSMAAVGLLFRASEQAGRNVTAQLQAMVTPDQQLHLRFDAAAADKLLAAAAGGRIDSRRASLGVIYSYGNFTASTSFVRSTGPSAHPIEIDRGDCLPANRVLAFFKNPFGRLDAARTAPLRIDRATIAEVPSTSHGWRVALALFVFMAAFAFGPGVCVWLALSELMPTRIRSAGMSMALVLNQMVSTVLAAIFLPFAGRHGYAAMFFFFAGCTVVYLVTAAFFLPETKGKTLEEIEAHFAGRSNRP